MSSPYVLVLYYSRTGHTQKMANVLCQGVESVEGMSAKLRTVPSVRQATDPEIADPVPEQGPAYVTLQELADCSGLIIGSPTHFGNMAAPLKQIFDQTTNLWFNGSLCNKPAACFTSTGSLHGGMESTLLSMMLPLMHHGMVICGLPYTEPALMETQSGGTPYGASHLAVHDGSHALDQQEKTLCLALGKRVAHLAISISCGN